MGILKKVVAVLKRGVCLLPLVLIPVGLTIGITASVKKDNVQKEVYNDIRQSSEFVQMQEDDFAYYEKKRAKGELSHAELAEKKRVY